MYVATEALYLTPSFPQIPCVIMSYEIHMPQISTCIFNLWIRYVLMFRQWTLITPVNISEKYKKLCITPDFQGIWKKVMLSSVPRLCAQVMTNNNTNLHPHQFFHMPLKKLTSLGFIAAFMLRHLSLFTFFWCQGLNSIWKIILFELPMKFVFLFSKAISHMVDFERPSVYLKFCLKK